ncbi:hypothetical protein P4C99_08040 [Pontiellaceae bacterium B1224]|nr:hypothetical protein [Pontiellaceae bacterium B1224]
MEGLLFSLLVVICVVVFVKSFMKYDAILQFPFLITCDLFFFLGPQLYSLIGDKHLAKMDGVSYSLFVVLCILFYSCALMGYRRPAVQSKIPSWSFDGKILIIGLYFLSLISLYGRIKLSALPDELLNMTQWSGLPVRYLFFASVGKLCLPFGIVLYFKYNNKFILIPMISELVSIFSMVVLSGRRTPAAFTGLMILTGLWFGRRMKIPLPLIIGGGVVFFMFVMNVGIYRAMLRSDEKVEVSQIVSEVFDIKKTLKRFGGSSDNSEEEGAIDARNGIIATSAVLSSSRYDYGFIVWNALVHNWVPGQIVGHGLKRALKVDVDSPGTVVSEEYGYRLARGSCVPGYAEVFASFGFLGCFFMYFLGKMARSIWDQAITGNLIAQICHFALAPVYLRFGGGGIWLLLSGLVFWLIFLGPILVFAKRDDESELRPL